MSSGRSLSLMEKKKKYKQGFVSLAKKIENKMSIYLFFIMRIKDFEQIFIHKNKKILLVLKIIISVKCF